ncbi:MAG: hypothetical protein RQ735_05915 [Flavobacteriaceae bacterium]|nr:hypothetical protein [Flavobacteriaceae bacterium]
MKSTLLISIIIALLLGCSSDSTFNSEIEAIEPECLQDIAKSILEEDVSIPKRTISLYNFKGEMVFVITPSSHVTEPAINVVNSNCETICLIGGIDGPDNDCEDFESAVFIETVWTDPR